MASQAGEPFRKQIRKAASRLRHWWTDADDDEISREVLEAWVIVRDYRATFQRPLDKVTIQLRRFVRYEVDEVIVAQRLKRMPTILAKLERQPTMDITRMQDIGGCRAVLPSAAKVEAVLNRMAKHWPVERVYNYVAAPKPSGYRAVHVSVVRDGRLIEIQFRTPAQQSWAAAVERAGARLRVSVKDGQGPEPLLRFFRLLGDAMALEEAGSQVDDALVAEIESLERQVRAILTRTG